LWNSEPYPPSFIAQIRDAKSLTLDRLEFLDMEPEPAVAFEEHDLALATLPGRSSKPEGMVIEAPRNGPRPRGLCVFEAAGVEFINGELPSVWLRGAVSAMRQATRIKLVEPRPVSEVESILLNARNAPSRGPTD
jgi:hypothetical protein